MSTALYKLADNYLELLSNAEEIDEQTLTDTLESIQGEIAEKAVNIGFVIRMLNAEADTIKAEEQRLAKKRKARENAVIRLKEYVQMNMERLGVQKITHPIMPVRIQNNPPALVIKDASQIPSAYLTFIPATTEVNNDAVKAALKAGEEIPGAELQVGRSLRIG